jgi:hypothetical protein
MAGCRDDGITDTRRLNRLAAACPDIGWRDSSIFEGTVIHFGFADEPGRSLMRRMKAFLCCSAI